MSDSGSKAINTRWRSTFGRQKKMRKTDEFSSVFRFRCVRSEAGIDFLAAPNGLDFPRLGMIVPKKIIPTAVARNRVKRLIREAFRQNQMEMAGIDVVARIKLKLDVDNLHIALQSGLTQCRSCLLARGMNVTQRGKLLKP